MVAKIKVKITVVKKFDTKDLFRNQVHELSPDFHTSCPLLEEGDKFIVEEDGKMPRDFCSWAWHDIHRDLTVQQWGGNSPLVKKAETVYTSCTDGLRPVIFQLERIE
ncbi:MAG: TIGR04076 family protein [Deltaproteobacteria bacterium]|nr:TIGR04076 family protein [Deltaproteobacteria bacterium]MBW2306584.1 TIGR04076 family protein [Deltaproteobacteria bacterium]